MAWSSLMAGAREAGVGGVGNTIVAGGTVGGATEVLEGVGVPPACEVGVSGPGVGRMEKNGLLAGRVGLDHISGIVRMVTTISTRIIDVQRIDLFMVALL